MTMRLDYLPLISVAVMLIVSAAAYAFLPETMAVHWTLALQPDGYAKKSFAVLILPLIGAGIVAMQLIGRSLSLEASGQIAFSRGVIFALPLLGAAHLVLLVAGLMSIAHG